MFCQWNQPNVLTAKTNCVGSALELRPLGKHQASPNLYKCRHTDAGTSHDVGTRSGRAEGRQPNNYIWRPIFNILAAMVCKNGGSIDLAIPFVAYAEIIRSRPWNSQTIHPLQT